MIVKTYRKFIVILALISAPGKEGFYRKFGLKNTEGSSMQRWSDEN